MSIERNELCPCGSGKKHKKCCLLRENNEKAKGINKATLIYYGPDDKTATKLVAAILPDEGGDIIEMRKWFSTDGDIRNDLQVAQELIDFLKLHQVRTTISTSKILGCPHEEGIDYPENEACPVCPFWKNRDRFA